VPHSGRTNLRQICSEQLVESALAKAMQFSSEQLEPQAA
jgi:hypothetical protein